MILMVMMMVLEDCGMRFSSCANAKATLAPRKAPTYLQPRVLAFVACCREINQRQERQSQASHLTRISIYILHICRHLLYYLAGIFIPSHLAAICARCCRSSSILPSSSFVVLSVLRLPGSSNTAGNNHLLPGKFLMHDGYEATLESGFRRGMCP